MVVKSMKGDFEKMNNKIVFGIMTIIFNELGVPSFMVKDTKRGVKTIIFGIITLGIISLINFIKGIINGIKILKMTDEEFAAADKAALIDALPGSKSLKDLAMEAKEMVVGEKKEEEAAEEATEEAAE